MNVRKHIRQQNSVALKLLGQYYRIAIFIGGGCFSLLLLTLVILETKWTADNYMAQARSTLINGKHLLQYEIQRRETNLLTNVLLAERFAAVSPPFPLNTKVKCHSKGNTVIYSDFAYGCNLWVIADHKTQELNQGLLDFLTYISIYSGTVHTTSSQLITETTGVFFSPDFTFLGTWPAPSPQELRKVSNIKAYDLIKHLAPQLPQISDKTKKTELKKSRESIWIPFEGNLSLPIGGLELWMPAFEKDNVFLVVGRIMSIDLLKQTLQWERHDGNFKLLDSQGRDVLNELKSEKNSTSAVRDKLNHKAPVPHKNKNEIQEDSEFGQIQLSTPIGNQGWSLVYSYDWRSFFIARGDTLLKLFFYMVFILFSFWFFILFLHKRFTQPIYHRAKQAAESQQLSQVIMQNVPIGLCLIHAKTGGLIMANDCITSYANSSTNEELWQVLFTKWKEKITASKQNIYISLSLNNNKINFKCSFDLQRYNNEDVILCCMEDITEQFEIEARLKAARQYAEQASKLKSDFLANISHEIRTPLNAILGNLELMTYQPLPEEAQKQLAASRNASKSLLDLLNTVLDFSKAEAHQMHLSPQCYDLSNIVQELTNLFEPLATAKKIALAYEIAPNALGHYWIDGERVRQILTNLLSNALKFTHTGKITTTLYFDENTQQHVLSVADTGIGIAADKLQILFNPFVQADASIQHSFGGSGLGLSLCLRLAQLMKGEVCVQSELGQGSIFSLRVHAPPCEAFNTTHIEAMQPIRQVPTSVVTPLSSILVAEDHPASQALLYDQLSMLGYAADIVASGRAALAAYSETHYDLILTDLSMPEMGGLDLARCLREQGAKLPIVGMTAYAGEEEHQACLKAGIDALLLKPLSLSCLSRAMRQHISKNMPKQVKLHDPAERQPLAPHVFVALQEASLKSIKRIDSALQGEDTTVLALELHQLQGGLGLAGLDTLLNTCIELEICVKAGDLKTFSQTWPSMSERISDALQLFR
ncbi:ATP-binding protein [Iodobacter fluviatilis]|uniref:Virulence sensor protein BvgS n=1 Tax=Iodobacter fluviatilis TaxID=537 RepID=A0A377Q8E7_9NEIS|nr:ATP-binding protein [Iodobacter fluviatilis]TCU81123.1 two-component system capsular synthesis sensor histidine kinase RcsC [Iodobacter fluviatilis]STQ90131.1 Sensor protein evgS precursor [Iodobacter fluviatilis]